MNILKNSNFAPALVLLAGSLWGVIGVFSRRLSGAGFSSPQITALRCLVTALCMLLFLSLCKPSLLKIKLRDLWCFLGTGLLSIVFFNICYFIAIQLTTLSLAGILLYTAPCIVTLLSALFFKEKLTPRKLFALLLAFAGCALSTGVFTGGLLLSLPGLLAGLGSGLGYALYSIFGRVALKKYSSYTVTAWTFFIAALGVLPFAEPHRLFSRLALRPSSIPDALILGVLCTLAPFLLYTLALARIDAGAASIMAFWEPVVGTLLGVFFFEEPFFPQTGIGIAFIFLSLMLLNLPSRKSGGTIRENKFFKERMRSKIPR